MLKKQPGFVLKKIKDSYYLLPFGQQVADQKKGLFLNETGAFLWECLCEYHKACRACKKACRALSAGRIRLPMLEEDSKFISESAYFF